MESLFRLQHERGAMTDTPPLSKHLTRDVLSYLGVEVETPSLNALDRLVMAYTRRVPWESASRIAKRIATEQTADCPRWAEAFWRGAMEDGTGGTCFESNYAFFSLLRSLGYEGYLTINDMHETVGCHSAIVIDFGEGGRYITDVGLPIHLPIKLDHSQKTIRETTLHTYSATPDGEGRITLERNRHPKTYCFTLADTPIAEADYRARTIRDYDQDEGLFLNRTIVTRIIDDRIWRFSGEGAPYQLESFHDEDKTFHFLSLDPMEAADAIAEKFEMNPAILRAALGATTL
jgi:arylamine N-acetyltransferase